MAYCDILQLGLDNIIMITFHFRGGDLVAIGFVAGSLALLSGPEMLPKKSYRSQQELQDRCSNRTEFYLNCPFKKFDFVKVNA